MKTPKYKSKILFIVKKRNIGYDGNQCEPVPYSYSVSSGLFNSARFVNDMLVKNDVSSHLVQVVDNNCIDREVTKYRPEYVVIEALWVVPEKFEVLRKLHPNVTWIVRLHSEVPFLANESIAIDWIQKLFDQPKMLIAFNSDKTTKNFREFFAAKFPHHHHEVHKKIIFLPNYYPVDHSKTDYELDDKDVIDVGCFGAVRPMKNQLIQAMAAIEFAHREDLMLRFHINSSRVERGEHALINMRSLFSKLGSQYRLIEHDWKSHADFIKLVRTMDIGMQLSFSETFNIVAADFVNNGVPFVGSEEIPFLHPFFQADDTDVEDMIAKMKRALARKKYMPFFSPSKKLLRIYVNKSQTIWLKFLSK